jgi:hypothetical protein
MTLILPADVNLTLVAHMLMNRRLAEGDTTTTETPDVGVTHSTAEEVWAVMFLVVVLILALCMCFACCGVGAQLLGCGSFITQSLLSCFGIATQFCTGCCNGGGGKNKTTTKTSVVAPDDVVPDAKVIGPAPVYEPIEELAPLRPKRETQASNPKEYTCCGFALPCLAWLSVCGCSFVGCAWLTTCWTRACGGGGEDNHRRGRREAPGGGLSFVQNLLTCWRCCGLLPVCCPAQHERPRRTLPYRRRAVPVATPKPMPTVVEGVPMDEGKAVRPMPALNMA